MSLLASIVSAEVIMGKLGGLAKKLRKEKLWTLRDVGVRSRVSISTISRFENGNIKVALSSVLAIFAALGYNLTFIAWSGPVYFASVEEEHDKKDT